MSPRARKKETAIPQYEDILIRDNFADTGVIPSVGTAWQSPDIIPLQGGTLSVGQAVSTYGGGTDQGLPIVSPGINNIYVRAKNLQPIDTETGLVSLYYSEASLLMLPTQWQQNAIPTACGQPSAPFVNSAGSQSLAPNEIALGNPAFLLTGLPPVSPQTHYCLVSIVDTPKTPITPPTSFPSNTEFIQWVQNTPAVAFRNIALISNTQQTIVKNTNFGSTNPATASFHVRMLGREFPDGTSIVAQCTDQRCPIAWNGTLPAPDPYGDQTAGFDTYVPGQFSGTLVVSVSPPTGDSFQPGSTLEVGFFQYPSEEADELEQEVGRTVLVAPTTDGAPPAAVEAFLIELGQVTFAIRAVTG